jgi:hypothetical protein
MNFHLPEASQEANPMNKQDPIVIKSLIKCHRPLFSFVILFPSFSSARFRFVIRFFYHNHHHVAFLSLFSFLILYSRGSFITLHCCCSLLRYENSSRFLSATTESFKLKWLYAVRKKRKLQQRK